MLKIKNNINTTVFNRRLWFKKVLRGHSITSNAKFQDFDLPTYLRKAFI